MLLFALSIVELRYSLEYVHNSCLLPLRFPEGTVEFTLSLYTSVLAPLLLELPALSPPSSAFGLRGPPPHPKARPGGVRVHRATAHPPRRHSMTPRC